MINLRSNTVTRPSPTNILLVGSQDSQQDVERLEAAGIQVLPIGPEAIRVVFHRDISDEDLVTTIRSFTKVMAP